MEQGSTIVFYLFGIPVSGYITTMWFIMAVLIGIGVIVTSSLQKVPGRFQALAEYTVEGLLNFFSGIMGPEKGRRYFPLCATLFLFILFSNMLGLFPGFFPGASHFSVAMHAPTTTLGVTVALAVTSFIAVQFIAIKESGMRHYLKKFVTPIPVLLPINILEELVRPVSLSIRLYGNIYAGEMIISVLLTLFFPVSAAFQCLDILFCLIQALVFSTLTAMYITLATSEH